MKKRLLIIASILFLAIMIPLTVNAATISAEPQEMKVGDIVTVTVEIDTANTEAVQFDLDFDATKYKYVQESATSELDLTGSNLLDKDTVRVVAFKFNSNAPVQTVELQFEAISAGKSVPFEVVNGTLEASVFDQANAKIVSKPETFTEPTAVVSKIEPNPEKDVKDPQYFDKDGNPITKHKPTGDVARATSIKSIAGVYTKLISGKLVVPYALPTSDDTLTVEDIKAEFGSTVDVTGLTNPVKSGDKFILNGQEHIVLIYGDVNKDGKVTAADALITRKYELNVLTPDEVTTITSNVGDSMEDSKIIQQFALRVIKKIPEKYPVEFYSSDFNFSYNTTIYRGERSKIATISLKDSRTISSDILSAINVPNATIEVEDKNGTIEIYATPSNSNSFSIAPTLTNNNIENGKIAEQPKTITVEEVKTVTNIELIDEAGNKVTDNYSLISGEMQTLTIKYYHTYPDGKYIELNENTTSANFLDINKVKLTPENTTILRKAILLDSDGNLASSTLNFVHKIKLESTLNTLGTENLTISIINDSKYSSTTDFNKIAKLDIPLNVTVANESVTGIKINGKVPQNNTINMNIYSAAPADYHINDSDGDSYFTALDIELLTNKGNTKKLTSSVCNESFDADAVKDPDLFTICQVTNPESSYYLRIVYLTKDSSGVYHLQEDPDAEFDAIGISYYDSYDVGISELKDGLKIYFGNGQEIKINVTPVDNRTSDEGDDPLDGLTPPETDYPDNDSQPFSLRDNDEEDEMSEEAESTEEPATSPDATTSSVPTTPVSPEANGTPVATNPVTTPEIPEVEKTPEDLN